jgi:hypothetical protein
MATITQALNAFAFTSIVQAAAALYIFYVSAVALNRMTKNTNPLARWAHIALACGSAAGFVSCFAARDLLECVFVVGVALFLAGNRRSIQL